MRKHCRGSTLAAAASAVEDWESDKQHKMLTNTALDRAKALSTEAPSLLPFAVDLVSLSLAASSISGGASGSPCALSAQIRTGARCGSGSAS